MRRSKIETDEFIGPFETIHKVGDYQYMVFQDGDPGPFYLSKIGQVALKFDCVTGETRTKKRKKICPGEIFESKRKQRGT
jgi:hypothetical protein